MRVTLSFYDQDWPIPADVKLGDTFDFTATAVVTALENELIDVSSYGQGPGANHVASETRVTLTLTKAKLA